MNTTYPFQAWVLMPSFKPKEVTIVKQYISSSPEYQESASSSLYHKDDLYPSKAIAIATGRELLVKQKATLDKRLETLNKKQAALDKAEAELKKETQ